jgi:O-Antigen ligase
MVLSAMLVGRPAITSARSRPIAIAVGCLASAFALRIGLSFVTVGNSSGALGVWVDAILLPAGLFLVARRSTTDARKWRAFASAFAAAGMLLAVVGIAERIWGFELASLSGGLPRYDASVGTVRISGPYTSPEVFALSLLICFAITLYWMQVQRGAAYVAGLCIALLEATAIGLTLFRAAWIAAILILVITVSARPHRSARTVGIAVIGSIIALVLHLFGNVGVLSERLDDSNNIYGRLATYQQGWTIFRSAPLIGVGVNQFVVGQDKVSSVSVGGTAAVKTAHSTFVSVLAEQGLVGFLPLLIFSFCVWHLLHDLRGRSTNREELLALGAFRGGTIAYLVMSFTLTMWPYGSSNAFFFALLGAAAGRAVGPDVRKPDQ